LIQLDEAGYYGFDPEEIRDSYWEAAKRSLTTSIAIVQQGVELLLKGKIAEISPYLLISDQAARWPSPYTGTAVDFSQFRTIDAQDLIRVHDTFASNLLDAEFSKNFHSRREQRNVIMHSTGKHVAVHVTEVIESILFAHKALFPQESWLSVRRSFLENDPSIALGSGDYVTNNISHEASIIIQLLTPGQVKKYFSIDKKQRSYICPACLNLANTDAGFDYKLAVLRPKSAKATKLYCPICDAEHDVERINCSDDECLGNVLDANTGTCLTCGA
jgi:hypothetical protein